MRDLSFSVVKENLIEAGKRVLKVVQFGAKTASVASSFGDDSAPLKNMVAIYAETSEVGDSVIVGYLNENQIAKAGEKRIFSLNPDGSLSTCIHLKAGGLIDIGEALDNPVRYTPLQASLNAQDALINAELAKIAVVLNTLIPNSYTPAPVSTNAGASIVPLVKI